jgi:hypothetical protein
MRNARLQQFQCIFISMRTASVRTHTRAYVHLVQQVNDITAGAAERASLRNFTLRYQATAMSFVEGVFEGVPQFTLQVWVYATTYKPLDTTAGWQDTVMHYFRLVSLLNSAVTITKAVIVFMFDYNIKEALRQPSKVSLIVIAIERECGSHSHTFASFLPSNQYIVTSHLLSGAARSSCPRLA